MRTIPDCELLGPAYPATDAPYAIGHNRFPIPGAAEHDTALKLTPRNRLCDRPHEVGIIARRIRIRPEVTDRVPLIEEHRLDCFLIGIPCVVGTDGDGERAGHVSGLENWPQETRPHPACRYSTPGLAQQTNF